MVIVLKIFQEYEIKDLQLKNRIVMPPMCMYSADEEGMVQDFHRIHYGARALGGVGLIILEATAVVPNGRISSRDLGIWDDSHIEGLKSIIDNVKPYGAKIGIQLAHAGRKCESDDEYIVAPSPIPYSDDYRWPKKLSKEEIKEIVNQFKAAAERAEKAGFDLIEIHGAHGYLISEFLSPLSNKREDEYGGSRENRTRFLKEILDAIKTVWPEEKPISLRVSADDYTTGGIDKEEMAKIIDLVKDSVDIVHVSSGGVVSVNIIPYPGYQVPHAEYIKKHCNVATIAVGLITEYTHMEEILGNDRSDLIAIGRELLRNPFLPLHMAYENNLELDFPIQYAIRAFPE